jgi:hypothetical protein
MAAPSQIGLRFLPDERPIAHAAHGLTMVGSRNLSIAPIPHVCAVLALELVVGKGWGDAQTQTGRRHAHVPTLRIHVAAARAGPLP